MKSVFPVSLSCCRCQRYQKPGSPAFRWVLCQRIGAPRPAPDSRLVDAKVTSSLGLGDAPPLQNLVGRIREADLGLTLLGVGEPQVGKMFPELAVTIWPTSFLGITLLAILAGLLQTLRN